jgi:hypothetical protein
LSIACRITRQRGEMIELESVRSVIATWHPSAILRAPTDDDRRRMRVAMNFEGRINRR